MLFFSKIFFFFVYHPFLQVTRQKFSTHLIYILIERIGATGWYWCRGWRLVQDSWSSSSLQFSLNPFNKPVIRFERLKLFLQGSISRWILKRSPWYLFYFYAGLRLPLWALNNWQLATADLMTKERSELEPGRGPIANMTAPVVEGSYAVDRCWSRSEPRSLIWTIWRRELLVARVARWATPNNLYKNIFLGERLGWSQFFARKTYHSHQ